MATTACCVGWITCTFTNMPGRGLLAGSGIAARIFTLRVVESIVGSMALIVPVSCSCVPSIVTRTGNPTLTVARSSCGSEKSTNVPPIESRVVTIVPGVRYWPTLTARMPSRPRNGARMTLRSTCARSAAASVVADSELGLHLIELRRADGVARRQNLGAFEGPLRQVAPRVRGRQLRALDLGVQLDQHLALAHDLARFEADLADGPRDLVADGDAAQA